MEITLTKQQLKAQWEDLKQTNSTQKEKNTWKRNNLLETETQRTANCWRLMTNRELEQYFS